MATCAPVGLAWLLYVHVLDDGDSEVAKKRGEFGFNYIVRDDRPELKSR
jgi:hypothetical protein